MAAPLPAQGGPPAPGGADAADRHRIQLDGVRAFAIFAVFMEHWTPWGSALRGALPWGSLGVRLFFVLSGYLITDILVRNRVRAEATGVPRLVVLRRFMARRVLRIFPALYLVAVAMAVLGLGASRETLPYTLTYTANLYFAALGTWPAAVAHFWSLGVEEQFYLCWPWLMLFAPRRRLALVVVAAIGLAPLARLVVIALGGNQVSVMCLPTSCLDTLGAGALLALSQRRLAPERVGAFLRGRNAAILGTLLGGVLWVTQGRPGTPSHSAMVALLDCGLALAFAPLVAGAASGFRGPVGRLLAWPPLVYVGKISYGLYLLHVIPVLLGWPLARLGFAHAGPLSHFAAYLAVSVAAASASWFLLEKPINDLKRRFPYLDSRPGIPDRAIA